MAGKRRASVERIQAPRQDRSAATVQAIEQAVDELVQDKGLAALSAKAVATRAGVGPGTLYQYFRTREALVASWELRMIQREVEGLYAMIADLMAQDTPIEKAIWQVGYKGALVMIAYSRADHPSHLRSSVPERLVLAEPIIATLASFLPDAPERHRLIPKDILKAVRVAVYAVTATSTLIALRKPSPEEADLDAREIADMVTRYLIAPAVPRV